MKTDYFRHESLYKSKLASGQDGWDAPGVSSEVTAQFKAILAHTDVPKNTNLLELGCGAGNLSVGFAALGYQVTGVDISPTAVARAQKRSSELGLKLEFNVESVLALPERFTNQFSLALDSHCFHCIVGEDRATFLQEVQRCLTPGGVFVVNTMCQNARTETLPGFDASTGIVWVEDFATRYIGTPKALDKELENAGFRIVESRTETEADKADIYVAIARTAHK